MSPPTEFAELIRRARRGDADACQELFERFHKVFYRTIAIRLENNALRGLHGVEDICQTVFKSFFFRLNCGQFELNGEKDLINLLLRMAHNKLTAKARHEKARPTVVSEPVDLPRPEPSPSQVHVYRDLFQHVMDRFSEEERGIYRLRIEQQLPWAEVAARMGGSADGRCKQWARATERVAAELGLDAF
jgi:RNA polymerase sigma-70 factor, ECF subfamily